MDFTRRRVCQYSIRPHNSAHSGDSSTQRPTLPSWPSIRSFTWQGLETSYWSSSRSLDRPTAQRHWLCSFQPLETGHLTGLWWSNATARAGYAMTTTTTIAVNGTQSHSQGVSLAIWDHSLPPETSEHPALSPAKQAGTPFTYLGEG